MVLDPDEAVCAVRDAGSLIGFVGDLGLGFLNPVWGGGDAAILVLLAAADEAVVARLVDGFEG